MHLRSQLRMVSNQGTLLRIVGTIALFGFARGDRPLFLALFVLTALTDVLDGYLARRLHTESSFGRRLDSFAGYFLILSSLYWTWVLEPGVFGEPGGLLYATAAAVILKSLEETAICLLVLDPYADLRPSVFHYPRRIVT